MIADYSDCQFIRQNLNSPNKQIHQPRPAVKLLLDRAVLKRLHIKFKLLASRMLEWKIHSSLLSYDVFI